MVDQPVNPASNFSLPTKTPVTNSSSKIRWLIIIFLLLSLGGGWWWLAQNNQLPIWQNWRSGQNQPESVTEPVAELTPTEKNLVMGKRVLEWLSTKRDEDDKYFLMISCHSKEKCDSPALSGVSGHEAIPIIWARYKYYIKTGDETQFEELKKDLDLYSNRQKIESIQNDLWNCSLMYDLWQDQSLPASLKDQARQVCWNSTYYPHPELNNYLQAYSSLGTTFEQPIKEIKDLDLDQLVAGNQVDNDLIIAEGDADLLTLFINYATDYSARYRWQQDAGDLLKARFHFNKAIKLYTDQPQLFTATEVCQLGFSSAKMYLATNYQPYLNFASDLMTSHKVDSRTDIYCTYLANELVVQMADKKPTIALFAQDWRDGDLNYRINQTYDAQDYVNGENNGSFFSMQEDGRLMLGKNLRLNALIANLLIDAYHYQP